MLSTILEFIILNTVNNVFFYSQTPKLQTPNSKLQTLQTFKLFKSNLYSKAEKTNQGIIQFYPCACGIYNILHVWFYIHILAHLQFVGQFNRCFTTHSIVINAGISNCQTKLIVGQYIEGCFAIDPHA